MKPCTVLEALYSKFPDLMSRDLYREHIETCPHCRADEVVFEDFIAALGETDSAGRALSPSRDKQQRVVAAAARRRSLSLGRRRPAMRWAAAASMLFIAGALVFYLGQHTAVPRSDIDPEASVSVQRRIEGKNAPVEVLSPPLDALVTGPGEQMLIQINDDGLTVMEETRLAVTDPGHSQTRVRLDRGTVHFSVSKRVVGEFFLVNAPPFQIRVIGTRFSATLSNNSELTVSVSEGVVEVIRPENPPDKIAAGQSVHFTSGRRFDSSPIDLAQSRAGTPSVDDAVSNAAPDGGLPFGRNKQRSQRNAVSAHRERRSDMDTWRRMIVAGAYNQVENELHAHLAYRPNDWQAWSLLADCLRKNRKWSRSVSSYQKSIELAPPMEANRSRLIAAAVLQNHLGQHQEAVRLLEDYLRFSDDGASIKAEIMVRLATSYAKLNDLDRAEDLLLKVIHQHRGNPIAKKAQSLLNRIAPSSSVGE